MIVGSGIDVIEIARIERAVARQGQRFLRRIFAPSEITACSAAGRPGPHLAVRFAAKEAVMKAVGTGFGRGVRWVDIETVPAPGEGSSRLSVPQNGQLKRVPWAISATFTRLPHWQRYGLVTDAPY